MKKPFTLFLSARYLKPQRSFVSIITLISVGLVAVGVWALTVVLSVMNGLGDKMRDSIAIFEPHLQVTHPNETMSDWKALQEMVRKQPGVIDARPYTQGQAILDFRQRVKTVKVMGLSPEPGPMVDKLASRTKTEEMGKFDFTEGNSVISAFLAEGMHIDLGEKISLLTLANGRELLDAQNESRKPQNLIPPFEFTVSGFYDSGSADPTTIFVALKTGQEFYGLKDHMDGIAADLRDPYSAEAAKAVITQSMAGANVEISTWTERKKSLFDALAIERLVMGLLLSMLVVVAAFAIMNTTITVTTRKRQEIGLMRAVGARTQQVVTVFMLQGLATGLIGTLFGLIVAFLTLKFLNPILWGFSLTFGLDAETREYLADMPVHIKALDLTMITVGSFVACALSALPPAFFAARLDPAAALRNLSNG